ncbi:MAG: exodeoxyribonuclease large subunit [Actinomycetota bacterium]|jgi:exodeoxyribonuclease VII large subunit
MSQIAFDLDLDDGGNPTYTVAELSDAINGALRRSFSDGVWVTGEIQGWNKSSAGHIYFNLVEIDEHTGAKATLRVAFFAGAQHGPRERFRRAGLKLGDGLTVRVFGMLDFFAGSGQITLKMTDIDPRFTLGALALQRDDVIRRLVSNGLFDANRRCHLSPVPLRVGVVASVGSAAWADFLHEIERSGYGFQLMVADVRVQGDSAVEMVTAAIRSLGRRTDLDVVVVIRGGGARTELATFDHEAIAVAIAQSDLPVFTGLGHEIDRSVADAVAHSALKTPTACATSLVEHVARYEGATDECWRLICARVEQTIERHTARIDDVSAGLAVRAGAAIDRSEERLHHRSVGVRESAVRAVVRADAHLTLAARTLLRTPGRLEAELKTIAAFETQVRLLDPANTMARGWSITRGADGRAIRDVAQVQAGDLLITSFSTGTATSRVESTQAVPAPHSLEPTA